MLEPLYDIPIKDNTVISHCESHSNSASPSTMCMHGFTSPPIELKDRGHAREGICDEELDVLMLFFFVCPWYVFCLLVLN